MPSIDESEPKHGNNRAGKNWVIDFQWENGFFLGGPEIIRQISFFSHRDSKFSAISPHKRIKLFLVTSISYPLFRLITL